MGLGPFDPLKVLRHRDRLEGIARGETVPPVTVEIDPTNACNHDCIWCISGGFRARNAATLSRELLLRLLIELAEYGVRSVTFTGGGEPLLHAALPQAMRVASEAGLEVGLVTNGELLSGEKLAAAAETCSFVRVSLDAGNAETYAQMHRPKAADAYERVLRNIGDLISARGRRATPTVGAAYLAHPANVGEIRAAARALADIGADYLQGPMPRCTCAASGAATRGTPSGA